MPLPDNYTLRARLFPAVIAIAPAIVFAIAYVSGNRSVLGLPDVLLTLTVGVLFFALADLSRKFGRRVEKKLFAESGGRPFPTVLRHRDSTIDSISKARYHKFLAGRLGETSPTADQERIAPVAADQFYARAGAWLRERTRDQSSYQVLFAENVTYGFRRNLLGLKWPGLSLNMVTVAICIWLVARSGGDELERFGPVLIVAALHAMYFLFAVSKASVLDAADQFGRQLVLACEPLGDIGAAGLKRGATAKN